MFSPCHTCISSNVSSTTITRNYRWQIFTFWLSSRAHQYSVPHIDEQTWSVCTGLKIFHTRNIALLSLLQFPCCSIVTFLLVFSATHRQNMVNCVPLWKYSCILQENMALLFLLLLLCCFYQYTSIQRNNETIHEWKSSEGNQHKYFFCFRFVSSTRKREASMTTAVS